MRAPALFVGALLLASSAANARPARPSSAERVRTLRERLTHVSTQSAALGQRAKALTVQTKETVQNKPKLDLRGDPELKALSTALTVRSGSVSLNGAIPRAQSAVDRAARAWIHRAHKTDLAEQSVAEAEAALTRLTERLRPLEVNAE
jgi:hypothetical protein